MTSYLTLPDELTEYINEWEYKQGGLIMILHAVQNFYGYVPKEMCFILSKKLNVPLARIYEVLTFYNYFRLESSAKYKIALCMGTACYLKGAPEILKTITDRLGIEEGKVTPDGLFGLEKIRCLGCCALAPVVTINGKVYGKLDKNSILNILDECCKAETND